MSSRNPSGRRRIAGERAPGRAADPQRDGHARPSGRRATRPAVRTPVAKTGPVDRTGSSFSGAARVRGRGAAALRPPRHALRWLVPLVLLTVAAIVFAVVMGTRGLSDYRQANGVEEARSVAAPKAGQAAQTIFSFKYNHLDDHLTQSKQLMTASFAKKFEKIAPALTKLAPQRKIDVKATTRDAAVEECGDGCSPDKATVLVFFDQSRTMPSQDLPTVFGQRVEIAMVKQDGRWLVDDITAL